MKSVNSHKDSWPVNYGKPAKPLPLLIPYVIKIQKFSFINALKKVFFERRNLKENFSAKPCYKNQLRHRYFVKKFATIPEELFLIILALKMLAFYNFRYASCRLWYSILHLFIKASIAPSIFNGTTSGEKRATGLPLWSSKNFSKFQ